MPIQQLHRAGVGATKAPLQRQNLSKLIEDTLTRLSSATARQDDPTVPRIEVHESVSNVAWAYEKLRNAIDYQDEHLLRKNAIERILKRRLISGATATQVAEPLILELIRSRYLPNASLPTTLITETALVINRYVYLWSAVTTELPDADRRRLQDFWYGIMSVEINELLSPVTADEALAELMYAVTYRDIQFAPGELEESEKNIQLYIAIHRSLLKSDSNIIRYHLIRRQFPDWGTDDPDRLANLGAKFPAIHELIESQLLHPTGDLLQRIMKKYAMIFWTFEDLVLEYGPAAQDRLSEPETVKEDVAMVFERRRRAAAGRIFRSVVRSIIYVFITKMAIALLLELPVDRLLAAGEAVPLRPLLINIIAPPFILLLIGITNRVPGKKNLEALQEKIAALLYKADERNSVVKPRKPIRRSGLFTALFRLFYALVTIIVFGAIITGLISIGFTPFSIVIFLLFLTIVSFFGIRVRLYAKELLVVDQRENAFSVLFDFLTVPILQVGRWIALRAPKINVLIFFFDVIIEAPFKAFLEATEGFFGFLREKREEIY